MQLVAYGAQDVYLTGNPQITFFKVVYRRHTNFAMESIQQTFNGTADFGKRVSCTISRNGDLIHRMYLQVDIPAVSIVGNSFRWIDSLGHILISTAELQIGGQRIDFHYGDWLEIFNELTLPSGLKSGYQRMIGNTLALTTTEAGDQTTGPANTTIEKPQTTLYIPLQFFFCRNPGLALPLIALQYHEVVINIEFNRAANCYMTGNDASQVQNVPTMLNPNLQNASLYVDYIYLDTDERRRFAQVSHEYLIDQLQFTGEETFTGSTYKSRLNFNHPVKELVWVVQRTDVVDNGVNQWVNYTTQRALDSALVNYNDTGLNVWSQNQFASTNGAVAGLTDAGYFGGRETTQANQWGGQNGMNHLAGAGVNDNNTPAFAWGTDPNALTAGNTSGLTNPHVFGGPSAQNCVWAAKLLLNGHDRFSERKGTYFNLVQPYQHHTNIPDSPGINVYSFAVKPEDHQPSGTCNMSRIDNATLLLTVHPDIASSNLTKKLRVYAVNYNVLRIMSGMGGLAYSN